VILRDTSARCLTKEQMERVSERCFTKIDCGTGAGNPLYVRIIADIVSRWTSFEPDCSVECLPVCMDEAINYLFDKIEERCNGNLSQIILYGNFKIISKMVIISK